MLRDREVEKVFSLINYIENPLLIKTNIIGIAVVNKPLQCIELFCYLKVKDSNLICKISCI